MLGGVEEPLAVLSVEVDLFDASTPFAESLELFDDLSVLKLLFDNRRRSWRKEGMPRRRRGR